MACCIDESAREMRFYDSCAPHSQHSKRPGHHENECMEIWGWLKDWVAQEADRTKAFLSAERKAELANLQWTFKYNPTDAHACTTPQQGNSDDCGVYAMMAIKYHAAGMPLLYGKTEGADHAIHLRSQMALELACGRLMSTDLWDPDLVGK